MVGECQALSQPILEYGPVSQIWVLASNPHTHSVIRVPRDRFVALPWLTHSASTSSSPGKVGAPSLLHLLSTGSTAAINVS